MTESIRDGQLRHPDAQDVNDATDARRAAEIIPPDQEDDVADSGDVSPHHGGRAQPGDVLGIETGGETTAIGDTAEDEDEGRREGEKYKPILE